MRIAIVTDAWHPQINGVVQTLSTTVTQLERMGHSVLVIEPGLFRNFACPSYPEIRLAWFPYRRVRELLRRYMPEAVHIATEGPVGAAARKWCLRTGSPFTTSYHTQFPEYLRARWPIPLWFSYAFLRGFHNRAKRIMVATPTMERRLAARGFRRTVRWTRGVDTELFRPQNKTFFDYPRPIYLYAGRVAVEKNIEAFLSLELPGTKVIVGDGPARTLLQEKYPDAEFVGYRFGEDLAKHIAAADVFVFPSRTDTFGLVLLEAMACGVPVAAYPVAGPIDVVQRDVTGKLDENLGRAARAALALDPESCRRYALRFTWEAAAEQFVSNLAPIEAARATPIKPTQSRERGALRQAQRKRTTARDTSTRSV